MCFLYFCNKSEHKIFHNKIERRHIVCNRSILKYIHIYKRIKHTRTSSPDTADLRDVKGKGCMQVNNNRKKMYISNTQKKLSCCVTFWISLCQTEWALMEDELRYKLFYERNETKQKENDRKKVRTHHNATQRQGYLFLPLYILRVAPLHQLPSNCVFQVLKEFLSYIISVGLELYVPNEIMVRKGRSLKGIHFK